MGKHGGKARGPFNTVQLAIICATLVFIVAAIVGKS